jgi:N-acetylglutamate synthase-like GNAT family acetyltransferase
MGNPVLVEEISFERIYPIWKEKLWPLRQSPIEPVSCINSKGEIDSEIARFSPQFFALLESSEIRGVVSCHPTSHNEMRLRGVWIDENFRGMDFGRRLVSQVIEAKSLEPWTWWLMCRVKNVEFFQKLHFQAEQEISQYEYGPHMIMTRSSR